MKKIIINMFVLLVSFNAFSEAKVILEKDGVTFTDEELVFAVKDQTPDYQDALAKDENLLNDFLKGLFVSRLVAKKTDEKVLNDKQFKKVIQLNTERSIHQAVVKKEFLNRMKSVNFETLAENEYEANKGKYKSKLTVDFYHLFFLKQNNLSQVDAKEKATDLASKLKDGSLKISEEAEKYVMSIAGVNEKGIVVKANPESLMPKIVSVLKKQKKGDVSDVIESESAYHIVSLLKINQPKFSELSNKLKQSIVSSLESELHKNILKEITLPYDDIKSYYINKENLSAVYEKIKKN